MGAAVLASPWAHRKGHRKMCWGMRAGLISHLWVSSATGDGERALSFLPRAVPHAAELNDSCWAFWKGIWSPQESRGHLQEQHISEVGLTEQDYPR